MEGSFLPLEQGIKLFRKASQSRGFDETVNKFVEPPSPFRNTNMSSSRASGPPDTNYPTAESIKFRSEEVEFLYSNCIQRNLRSQVV